jgi:hypothetical protein
MTPVDRSTLLLLHIWSNFHNATAHKLRFIGVPQTSVLGSKLPILKLASYTSSEGNFVTFGLL